MKIQVYDDGTQEARIFDAKGDGVCDLFLREKDGAFRPAADAAMKRIRIVRRGKWQKTEWGYEAMVRFASARHPKGNAK